MFRAVGRWVKALMYLMTGQIDSARRELDSNPHVIRAKYDEVIKDKTNRIQEYKQAISGLIGPQEQKMAKIKSLSEETEKLERLKEGALAKAKQRVAKLQGKSKEEIHSDQEYKSCLSAYKDFGSTLDEKKKRISELEGDVKEYAKRIADHKVQLQSLVRDLEKIKDESKDAVADIISSRQEQELADQLTGISEDTSAQELERLRDTRQQVKAEARISSELAGTDSKALEAEFLNYAASSGSEDEFDSLLGIAGATDSASREKDVESKTSDKLPE